MQVKVAKYSNEEFRSEVIVARVFLRGNDEDDSSDKMCCKYT